MSAAKVKARQEEYRSQSTPLPLAQEPFVTERLAPATNQVKAADKTRHLVQLWKGRGEELSKARKATFDYAIVCADGELEIFDHDGLAKCWLLVEAREQQLSKAEQAIRTIIRTDGRYLSELANVAYAYGKTENDNARRLDVEFRTLQGLNPNKNMTPDQITALPEYITKKKELDAETQTSNEILEQTRAKIAIYNKAFELAGI
jgi:hypothetical protein